MLIAFHLLLACVCAAARADEAPALEHRFYVSAEEARAQDPRALAEKIVARLKTRCDEAGPAVGPSPLGDSYELVVMVPAGALDSIRRDGLRNQHETGTAGGDLRPFARFETEQRLAMLRLPYGVRGRELLPKYAVLRAKALGEQPLPTRYGGVALVLRPEVAARATWTYADSLDFSRRAGLYELEGEANSVLPRTFTYKRRRGDANACVNYCEAQIWGPVTMDDVAEVRGATTAARALDAPGLRAGRAAAALSDSALIAAVAASTGAERARLIGDLAERAPAPEILDALDRSAASAEAFERELALQGLAAGPWKRFKPRLLAGLRDADASVALTAVALADEHRADADVARVIAALRASLGKREPSDARALKEWLDRLDASSLCPER